MQINEEEILCKLTKIFCDVLELDEIRLTREMTMGDIEGWDSLANVRLMVATESEFDTRFETDELASVTSIGVLVDLIEKRLV